jgi:hypothetical protein
MNTYRVAPSSEAGSLTWIIEHQLDGVVQSPALETHPTEQEAKFRAYTLARLELMEARRMPTYQIIQSTLTEWIIERRVTGEPPQLIGAGFRSDDEAQARANELAAIDSTGEVSA